MLDFVVKGYLSNGHFSKPKERYAKVCLEIADKETILTLSRAMESGEYSDLTILCKDQKFPVHKVVVCSQSKVLAATMKNGFKVLRCLHCYRILALFLLDQADLS